MAKTATAAKPANPAKTAIVTELKPDSEVPEKKKGSAMKWVLLGIVLLALVGGGGAAAWYFFMRGPPTAHAEETKPAAAAPGAPAKAPVFMNLEPFTVNLIEEGGEHYLQVGIVFQMSDDKVVDSTKVYLPVLRNKILLLLSSKRPSEIASLEGKNKLVAELIAAARESVPAAAPDHGIIGAFLSAFVIQ